MLKIRSFVLCVVMVAAAVSAMAAGQARAAEDGREAKLIAILVSDASPPGDKAITCKQLAICGTKAAVPALAALLPDEKLASWARIALEAIPDPAVDEALRQAAAKLQGRLLIGVINSIGVRRDAKAVGILVPRLKDADAQVASAAAAALGRIGGDPAVKALEPLLATAPAPVRSAVAEGCVRCAERYLADGKAAEAVKLYDTVRKADVPKQRVLEATRGAILARGTAGVPLLLEQLKSPDKALFGIGLRTARELPGTEATDALVAEMRQAASDRQALMLLALADRGDVKALPAVVEAAKSGPGHVRTAAMEALVRFGNASCVPVLLDAAIEADAEVAQAAKVTLLRLPGEDVDATLLARLPKASGKTLQVVIETAGQRRVEAALPAMVRAVGDADAGVRAAAVDAIGAIGGDGQLADLVKALQKTDDAKDQGNIEKAVTAISARGGATIVPRLAPLTKGEKTALRVIGLHAMASAGGPAALAAVKAAIDDKDEGVQDEAVRTLCTWPNRWPGDAGAAEVLLALAKSAKKVPHQVLALRGYLQYIQGAKGVGDAQRLAMAKNVLPLITRPEEKRTAVSVLGGIRNAGALEILTTYAADASVAEEACSAIVNLAAHKDVRDAAKEPCRKAVETVLEKSKNDGTKKRANEILKQLK